MAKTKNIYQYPVTLSREIRISYDESPAHVESLKHAVDFVMKEGTQILAACDGVVVDVKQDETIGGPDPNLYFLGNFIEIKHDHGEFSIYEHIKKDGSLVKKGEKVKVGQIIGFSGATGFLAHLGPHLHFDVHTYVGPGPEEYDSLEIRWKKGKPRKE